MTLRTIVAGALALWALVPARATVLIQSTFDQNLDGWSVTGDATTPSWKATAEGSDGGFAEASDQGLGTYWYWSAPSKFLGDRVYAYGQNLRFRLWESNTGTLSTSAEPDVVLKGDNTTLVLDLPPFTPGEWVDLSARLTEDAGWKLGDLSGPAPDANTMHKVLGNLDSLEIRGEYISGPDTGRLDNVVMELSQFPAPANLPITSNFNLRDEGWTVYGDAQGGSSKPTYRTTGGLANGPYLEATDNAQGGVWYWNAPPYYLGNVSGALGRSLTYYLRQSSLSNQFTAPDVVLEGGGRQLLYMERYHPGTDWTPFIVPLRAQSGWHVDTPDGPTPTTEMFRDTLTFLEALRIRGEFVTGPDTDGLDSVTLGAPALLTGDLDGDLQVSPTDAVRCLQIAGGLLPASQMNMIIADVAPATAGNYGDGRLDILDALRLLRHAQGLEPQWP